MLAVATVSKVLESIMVEQRVAQRSEAHPHLMKA